MKITDTVITIAGVLRCCLTSIGTDTATDKEFNIGDEVSCRYCKEKFRLTQRAKGAPIWIPLWQIEGTPERGKHLEAIGNERRAS